MRFFITHDSVHQVLKCCKQWFARICVVIKRGLPYDLLMGTIYLKRYPMNQRSPRIQITLKPEIRDIFQRLALAQSVPMATIIAEFLEEAAPALKKVARVVETAKDAVARAGRGERDRLIKKHHGL